MSIEKKYKYIKEGLLIIISSPSGAGKSTLCQILASKDKNIFLSVSTTTRKKRKSEIHGKHYKFIDNKKFNLMKKNDEFIEHAKVFGNLYGTPAKNTISKIRNGVDVLFDIDWQGAKQIRKKFSQHIVDIFIMPPNIKELRKRLNKRGQDKKDIVERRMKMAISEMNHYNEYKYVLFNNKINETIRNIKNIIVIERNLRKNLLKIRNIINKNKDNY